MSTAGAPVDSPFSMAIDTVARRVYWINDGARENEDLIGFASLDGGGGGSLNRAGATFPKQPFGLLVHPAGGRLYWADDNGERISYANLDGSGGGDLDLGGAPLLEPIGLAIDAAAGRIYWANSFGDRPIGSASLAGGAGAELPSSGLRLPAGLALDPAAGRIYAAGKAPTVSAIPFPGGGPATPLDTTGASTALTASTLPILLKAPSQRASAPAAKSGVAYRPGTRLSCGAVRWEGDLVEANLMQAPQTIAYQWLRNGSPEAGATGPEIVATKVGEYACRTTATNFAGSTSVLGGGGAIASTLRLKGATLRPKRGTATLAVEVTGPGLLRLGGARIVSAKKVSTGARTFKFTVRVNHGSQRSLRRTGSARVKARVTFLPAGGEALTRSRTIVLKRR